MAEHSRAFERFVKNSDDYSIGAPDLVGLLAYALYKQTLREEAIEHGWTKPSEQRNPVNSVVKTYRDQAENMLSDFANSAIDTARSEMKDANTISAIIETKGKISLSIEKSSSEIIKEIHRGTNWLTALVINIVGWFASVVVTIIIGVALYSPSWIDKILQALRQP